MSEEGGGCGDGVFKIGNLLKTSQSKTNQGTTRLRKFRLTCESLDYFQTFSHVSMYTPQGLEGLEWKELFGVGGGEWNCFGGWGFFGFFWGGGRGRGV